MARRKPKLKHNIIMNAVSDDKDLEVIVLEKKQGYIEVDIADTVSYMSLSQLRSLRYWINQLPGVDQ